MNKQLPPYLQDRNRDPMMLTWYRFVRVMKKVFHHVGETMETFDISRPQFDLLMQVAFGEGINQQTCARQMNVTKGNITQHIDRLEGRGLIRREKHGRINALYLTESGQELVAQIMPVHDEEVKVILSLLSADELGGFSTALRRLDRGLD